MGLFPLEARTMPSSISGNLFEDTNGDGVLGSFETNPLPGAGLLRARRRLPD